MKSKVKSVQSLEDRLEELLQYAKAIAATGATHTELWNAVFGIGARFNQLFPDRADRDAIANRKAMKQIRQLLLKAPRAANAAKVSKTGRLLVRLPKTIHAALADEAEAENVSLNQLIVSKLSLSLGQTLGQG